MQLVTADPDAAHGTIVNSIWANVHDYDITSMEEGFVSLQLSHERKRVSRIGGSKPDPVQVRPPAIVHEYDNPKREEGLRLVIITHAYERKQ